MGNFRSNDRGRGGYGGSRGGRGGGYGNRGGGGYGGDRDFERRPVEMHDVTCSKCGKRCQVPFKPTGSKPVFCNDCFGQGEGSRNQNGSSNGSSEQLNEINAKLDKILLILQELEVEMDDDSDEDDEDLEDDSEGA